MITIIFVLDFLIDKYIIYPSQGREFPETIEGWLQEGSKEGDKSMKEMKESIKHTFSFKK